MADQLTVKTRESRGTRRSRRMRADGLIPAVLYGHGEANVSLSVPADQLSAVVRHGSRVVKLDGDVREQALIRALQWDPFGTAVLHVDFARVSAEERVTVRLPIELRGEAPGAREGGVVSLVLHDAEIECKVTDVPEKLSVNINHLHVGNELTLKDLELPPGATLVGEPDEVVVQCVEPVEVAEVEAALGPAEPEVIGRAKSEEENEE